MSAAKLNVGLIVDSNSIDKWQYEALINCDDLIKISTIIFCSNSQSKKRIIKNGLYYVLNLISIKNKETIPKSWATLIDNSSQVINFECKQTGKWQKIDDVTKRLIADKKLDVVVKFGMNLLKDSSELDVKFGVLSFHHGDPTCFRGRPAGFYELAQNFDEIGAVVQEISNKLDAGKVRAFGKYQVVHHSYRQTLELLYSHSALLLRRAILNCLASKTVEIDSDGKNNRLPSNLAVIKFLIQLTSRKLQRIVFGAFWRRKWRIAEVEPLNLQNISKITQLKVQKNIKTPAGLSFIADPFILPNGNIICEATHKHSQRGFFIALKNGQSTSIDSSMIGSNHLSFPFVISENHQVFIMPEMAENGNQAIFEIDDSLKIKHGYFLTGLENERLIDPILVKKENIWWLFAGKSGSEADHLYLWSSEKLLGPYIPHRLNPVVTDPIRARNAGAFIESNGELFRLGQDNLRRYGDGITICRVTKLSHDHYEEVPFGQLKVSGARGPHTLSSDGKSTYIDFYQTSFDPLAWLTRIKSKLPKK